MTYKHWLFLLAFAVVCAFLGGCSTTIAQRLYHDGKTLTGRALRADVYLDNLTK